MTWLLLAEDNDDLRQALDEALLLHGYKVRTAADGAEAARMLHAATEPPAVLLLDLLMPRVSGLEVLRAMARDPARRVPVVVVTALEGGEMDVSALGVSEVLQKPFAVHRLVAAIEKARLRLP